MVSAAFSVTCARTHTHTIEAHTADNRRTLGSKLIITPWRSQRSLSIRREGTSLSNREITLSLSITKDLTEYRIFGITKHHNDEKKKKVGLGLGRQNSWQHVKDAKLCSYLPKVPHHHHHHLSLNHEGRWGTTNDFATSFLHFPLFSTALWDLANSRPVPSLMLSSHLFLYLPCLLPPFTVSCRMVLARHDERETTLYHQVQGT